MKTFAVCALLALALLAGEPPAPPVEFHGKPQVVALTIAPVVNLAGGFTAVMVHYRLEKVESGPSGKVDRQFIGEGDFDLLSSDRQIHDLLLAAIATDWQTRVGSLHVPPRPKDLRSRP